MKKYLVAALAISVMAAVSAVAVAQYQLPVLTFDATLTPTKAGTKKKPKASKIRLDLQVAKESRATADQLVFNLPEHARVSGKGFRYCPATRLDTTEDPKKCPKGSRVGAGTATAVFGAKLFPIDFDVTIFAGSRDELGIWLQSTNIKALKKATTGIVSKSGTPYGQKITIDIPAELQKHLGTAVYLTGLDVTVGSSNRKRGRKRRNLITTVGCPSGRKHKFQARVHFVPNPNPPATADVAKEDTSSCR